MNAKIKKFILTVLAVGVICAAALVMFKRSFEPEFYEKTDFTAKEAQLVSEYIHINCDADDIERATFSHAHDSVFLFYLRDIDTADIDESFYENEPHRDVTIDEQTGEVKVRFENYDSKLYKMIKNS